MQSRANRKQEIAGNCILLLGILIIFGLIVYTNLFRFHYKMNSDIASEVLLSKLIWESKEWIPKSWYASTELRIFGTPNLAALFFCVTRDMSLSMGLSCIAMTLGIAGSCYFFASQCDFSVRSKLLLLLLCLMLPNHFVTLELTYLWAGYYAIHVIILFLTLGMYIRFLKRDCPTQHDFLCFLLTIVFSFCMGMQGTRSILILSGPLFAVEILRLGCQYWHKRVIEKKDWITLLWTIAMLMAGFLGTRSGFSIGQELSRNIRNGLSKLQEVVLSDVLNCLGVREGSTVGQILLWICVIIMIAGLAESIWKVCALPEAEAEEWGMLFLAGSPIMTMVFVSFTTIESSERYYFVFLYAIAFAMVRWYQKIDMLSGKFRGGVWTDFRIIYQ